MNLPDGVYCENCVKTVKYKVQRVEKDGAVQVVCSECHEVIATFRQPPEKLYHIIITSGAHAYRYVGIRQDGTSRNPDVRENPPVDLPDTTFRNFSLWLQQGLAIDFPEEEAHSVVADLKRVGYEAELIEL